MILIFGHPKRSQQYSHADQSFPASGYKCSLWNALNSRQRSDGENAPRPADPCYREAPPRSGEPSTAPSPNLVKKTHAMEVKLNCTASFYTRGSHLHPPLLQCLCLSQDVAGECGQPSHSFSAGSSTHMTSAASSVPATYSGMA